MMSRADEERAKYHSRVAQIRNNLRQESKKWAQSSMMTDVLTQLNKVMESDKYDDLDSSCSEGLRGEMVEESKDDLSLSLIKNQQLTSEETS